MSRTAHKLMASSGATEAYEIEQSLKFNYSGQSYLYRTPSAVGNRKTWTLSFWAKLATQQNTYVFSGGTVAGSTGVEAFMLSGGWQDIFFGQSYAPTYFRTSTVYDQGMDPSSWYHIFHVHDTEESTAGNRSRTWINGVEFEEYTTELHNSFSYQDEDEQGTINTQVLHRIGGMDDNSQYMDGNFAEFHFIDGTVKAVGDFGETDSETGQWIPKEYTGGSYGTNGFYLPFKATTSKYSMRLTSSQSGVHFGNGDRIKNLTNKSFTTEGWIYPENDGGGSYDCIWSAGVAQQIYWDYGNSRIIVYYHDGSGYAFNGTASTGNVKAGQWCHFAVVRNGTSMTIYTHGVGGTAATSSASITSNLTDNAYLGSYKGEAAAQFKGNIYGVRHTIGTARYTSNFTPPTSDLTNDITFDDSTDEGVGFLQTTNSNSTVTDSALSATVTKYGSWTADLSSPTLDYIGTDKSGQGNDWLVANLDNSDVLLDTPTNNFPILNTRIPQNDNVITEAGLKIGSTTQTWGAPATMAASSGKWYFECKAVFSSGGIYLNIVDANSFTDYNDSTYNSGWRAEYAVMYEGGGGDIYNNNSETQSNVGTWSNGDIIACRLNLDDGNVTYYKNNSVMGSAETLNTAASGTWCIMLTGHNYNDLHANFGQNGTFNGAETAGGNADANGYGNFKYAVPTGYLAMCSQNLPDPAVKKSTDHFNSVLYAGNSSSQNITGVGFQPDLVWLKNRNEAGGYHHLVYDALRGVNNALIINDNSVQSDRTGDGVSAFLADGFTLPGGGWESNAGGNYVAYNWKANGTGSSNSDGSVTVTTSANATAGFSMIYHASEGYFGGTYGHGLGKKPAFIITRDVDNANNWYVWHESFTNPTYHYLSGLNTTAAVATSSANEYNPTSTLVMTDQGLNRKGITYVWAEIEGFSKFTSYKGNASANGPFVYCGFRPAWILVKNISVTENWELYDIARDPVNPTDHGLRPDTSDAEYDQSSNNRSFNLYANGFQVRGTNSGINGSGNTLLVAAFAEAPLKYANAR